MKSSGSGAGSGRPQAAPSEIEAEHRRIGDEILGTDRGTDPFVAAVRATRMPMIITNPRIADNPVVFANDAFCRLTGYRRDEILGRNCRFLQGPETDRAEVARVREAVAARRSIQVDLRNHRKDGSAFWNRLLLAPVLDAAGDLAYFFASQVDVTLEREKLLGLENQNAALMAELGDRLRAQEASEARLRFATRAGGLGIWELDFASGALYTSPDCLVNFGQDPERPVGRAELTDSIHPDDRLRRQAALDRSLETGDDYQIEYRVLRPDGKIGWLQVRAQVERGPDGRPLRMAGTTLDTTDANVARERNEMLLALDAVFNATDDPDDIAFAAAEALGRSLGVSRAGYGTVDLANETITIERDWNAPGIRTLAGALHFRDYGSYIEDLQRGETVVVADATADPRTRATAQALIGISAQAFVNMPVTESAGLVALLYLNHATAREWAGDDLAFVREVAYRTRMAVQRRMAERQLRALAATLEAQVAERTAELMKTEEALRQSQKMEAVGQLTGGLAHDFNNLLAGISGSIQLVRKRTADGRTADVERYLDTAMASTKRAAALTHRLLAFSRRQTLEPKTVDVNDLVAGLEDLVNRTIGPAITLRVRLAADLWRVRADAGQLENALLNLCINARDAMPDGGELTIQTGNHLVDEKTAVAQEIAAGAYVSVAVIDTGVGMPPEVVAKAFEPFFTTKPIGLGTGLGLSMVYGFARQSGGQVRIHSQIGEGTKVAIHLPHATEGDAPAEASKPVDAPPRAGDRTETVLVVDDEPTVRMLVVEELRELGYTTLEAADGPQAMKLLESGRRIDLLVTDVGLPGGMNGRQVAEAARTLRPGLRVLFITGYAENAVLNHEHLGSGMHVLTKPFEMEDFGRRVHAIIASAAS
jgi:PAS domain S-box-containing protein